MIVESPWGLPCYWFEAGHREWQLVNPLIGIVGIGVDRQESLRSFDAYWGNRAPICLIEGRPPRILRPDEARVAAGEPLIRHLSVHMSAEAASIMNALLMKFHPDRNPAGKIFSADDVTVELLRLKEALAKGAER